MGSLTLLGSLACSEMETDAPEPTITVVTFNTGTPNLPGEGRDAVDMYYGNGLSWQAAIDDTRAFFARIDPDIVAFQEIFHPAECAAIPPEAHAGFICETWRDGDPTVAQEVLGDGWQIACHLGKPDKCLAVNRRLGHFAGCDGDLCLDGLDGAEVPDCGSGSRIGRGVVALENGGELTVVSVHGTSGLEQADQDCRLRQFEQIFSDLDGEPAANGERNVILGDLNTDPARFAGDDESAALFAQEVDGDPFHFITEVGTDVTPTYTLVNIDHVVSDALDGRCSHPGLEGEPPVAETPYFDHKPAVCEVDVP